MGVVCKHGACLLRVWQSVCEMRSVQTILPMSMRRSAAGDVYHQHLTA